jgi:hypothetical protein
VSWSPPDCLTLAHNSLKVHSWLLVFDNVEDYESIAPYWPSVSKTQASIIVTTQKQGSLIRWTTHKIHLTPFKPEDGTSFLMKQLDIDPNDSEREQAEEISDLVQGLPLTLNYVSGYIRNSGCSMLEYLEMHHESSNLWEGDNESDNWMYERTQATVFDIAFARLSEDATKLLRILAFLNPEGVPECMLISDHSEDHLQFLSKNDKHRYFI